MLVQTERHEDAPNRAAAASPGPGAGLATTVDALKALGEPTRLRIAALLSDGELTVSELCRILGQSQPRVSHHLRTLLDAGLLRRAAQGTSAFYGLNQQPMARSLVGAAIGALNESAIGTDRARLAAIRQDRADQAADYFEQAAGKWEAVRELHVTDGEVEAAITAIVDRHLATETDARNSSSHLLDLGTGTGRILQLIGDRFDSGLGIDLSANMLNLARSNMTAAGLDHCAVRQGNLYALDADPGRAQVVVLHHVLHFLDAPSAVLAEAARALGPGGLLIIVDFAPHDVEELRREHAHFRLGVGDEEIASWLGAAGLAVSSTQALSRSDSRDGTPASAPEHKELTTKIWTASHQ